MDYIAGALHVGLAQRPDPIPITGDFITRQMSDPAHDVDIIAKLPAPVSDKRYVAGLYAWENRWIYLTHGVGNLHGLRINCRPQVSVLDLV